MSEYERSFNSPAEKTDCNNCAHQAVCAYKDAFQNAQKMIDDLHINERFPWIEEIQLRCRHFMRNRVFREEIDLRFSYIPNEKPVFEKDELVEKEEMRALFHG